nr:glcnac transferase [Pandoravirus massiliensis]
MGLLGKGRWGVRAQPDPTMTTPLTHSATPWRTRIVRAVCIGLVAAVIVILIAASIQTRARRLLLAARMRARCRSTDPDAARRTIFVSVVARGHRDERAAVTLIGALFDRARHPGRVHIGLCRCSAMDRDGGQQDVDHDGDYVDNGYDDDDGRYREYDRSRGARHNGKERDGTSTRSSAHIDNIVAAYGAAYPHHEGRFDTNVRVLTEEPTSERGAANAMLLVQRHLYRGQRYYATVSVNCRPCQGWDVAALSDLDRAALHQSSASKSTPPRVVVTMRLLEDEGYSAYYGDDDDSDDDGDSGDDGIFDNDDNADKGDRDFVIDSGGHDGYRTDVARDARADPRIGAAKSALGRGQHNGGSSMPPRFHTGAGPHAQERSASRDKAAKGKGAPWTFLVRGRGRRRGTLPTEQPAAPSWPTLSGRRTTPTGRDTRSARHRPPTFAVFEMWSPRGLPVLRTRAFRYTPVRPFGTPFWHSDFSLCDAAALVRDAPWDPWYEHLPLDGAIDWCTTLRLWTRGWDFYSPTRALVRRARGRVRDECLGSPVDLPRRVRREREAAYARAWALLGLEVPWRPYIEPCYALGTARSVAAFMRQSGLDWLDRRADAHAFVGMLPLGDAGVGVAARFDQREVAAKYGSWARFLDETDYRGGVAVHW